MTYGRAHAVIVIAWNVTALENTSWTNGVKEAKMVGMNIQIVMKDTA